MARLAVVACMMAVAYFTPVTADFATYLKFGQHATQMQTWKTGVKNYISSMTNLANYLRSDTEGLNSTIQAAMQSLEQQTDGMNSLADSLLTRLSDMENNLTEEVPDYEAPLAFQAYVIGAGVTPLAVNYLPIKYGDIVLNDGGHYNSSTGLFTAPITGLYWFHATLTASQGKREVYVKKTMATGGTENIAYLNFYNGQETACTTVTIMHPGDTVGMYPATSTFENWDLPGSYANTFAGYLVARYDDPDYDPSAVVAATTPPAVVGSTAVVDPTTSTDAAGGV